MNFGFDADQKSLGETVARVLSGLPALSAPGLAPPPHAEVWDALAALGLFSLLVPERFDGVGMSLVDLALCVEALGAGLAPPVIVSTLVATDVIVRHGSEAQQRKLLPAIAAGTLKIAIAVLEAERGYDPLDVRTTFAGASLDGEKILVGDADAADLFIVVVRRDDDTPALVMVRKDAPGVVVRPHNDLDPTSGNCAVTFHRVAIDKGAVLGEAAPSRAVERLFDAAATVHAGLLIGIAAKMLAASVEYAQARVQFDQPIGAFQAIKHRCADMAVAVEAGRSVAYYAFWAVAEDAPDRARAASMAKAYCGDVARQVGNETIQVHGGMGFTWELGLHRYLRRAKLIEHSYGDAAWHNERILAATLTALATAAEIQRDAA